MEEGRSRVEREVLYHGRDRNLAGPVSHQKSLGWMSSPRWTVLLQRTKAAGGGRGRGGGFLTAGDGQARAGGGSPSAIREQWLALLLESLPRISAWALPQWDEKRAA